MAAGATPVNDWQTVDPGDWQTVGEKSVPGADTQSALPGQEPEGFWHSLATSTGIPQLIKGDPNAKTPTSKWDAFKQTVETVNPFSPFVDMAKNAYQHLGAAGERVMAGDPNRAMNEAAGAVPVFGPNAYKAGQQLEEGDYAGAAGTTLGTIGQALIPESIRRAPAAAAATRDLAMQPGNPDILVGSGVTAGGVHGMVKGNLGYGGAATAYGLGRIWKGVMKNKAAAMSDAADATEAAPPPPNQFVGPRQAAWQDLPDSAPPDVAPLKSIPGTLPSGRNVGPAPALPPPPTRTPLWQGNQQPTIPQPPDITSLPSQLPSGRTPGGIGNQVPSTPAPAAASAPAPAVPTAPPGVDLDQLARSLGGKSFNKLDAKGQSYVQAIADRINNPLPAQSAPAGTGSPSVPQGPIEGQGIPTPEAPAHVANRQTLAREAAKQIFQSGASSDDVQQYMMNDDDWWDKVGQSTDIARGTPKGERRVNLTKEATRAETIRQLKALEISDKINQSLQQP